MISMNYSLLPIQASLSLMDGIHRINVECCRKEVKREKKHVLNQLSTTNVDDMLCSENTDKRCSLIPNFNNYYRPPT